MSSVGFRSLWLPTLLLISACGSGSDPVVPGESVPTEVEWTWVHPTPQGNAIFDIRMLSADEWMATTQSSILRTSDAGATWTNTLAPEGTNFGTFDFAGDVGFMAAWSGNVWRTNDAGRNWSLVAIGGDAPWRAVNVVSPGTVVLNSRGGPTYLSRDGGTTWVSYLTSRFHNAADFVDGNLGFAVGGSGIIDRTVDGGGIWTEVMRTSLELYAVAALDSDIVFAAGSGGQISRSTDGGQNWNSMSTDTGESLLDLAFVDFDTGFAAGTDGVVLRTTDGGSTWFTRIQLPGSNAFYAIDFFDDDHGVVGGYGGTILATNDGGDTWQRRSTQSTLQNLLDVDAVGDFGMAVGNDGTILVTEDGGRQWRLLDSVTEATIRAVDVIDEDRAFAVGRRGSFLRTVDGGTTWTTLQLGSSTEFDAVAFVDSEHGFAATTDGEMLRTTDGGLDWTLATVPMIGAIHDIAVVSSEVAYAAGRSGVVLKTLDGGVTWFRLTTPNTEDLLAVHFFDENVGAAVGNGSNAIWTDDGGDTWEERPAIHGSVKFDIRLVSPTTAWMVSDFVAYTTDAGRTWTRTAIGVSSFRTAITFVDEDTAIVVGFDGGIHRSTNARR